MEAVVVRGEWSDTEPDAIDSYAEAFNIALEGREMVEHAWGPSVMRRPREVPADDGGASKIRAQYQYLSLVLLKPKRGRK